MGLGGWVGRWGWRLSVIILCNYKTHLLNSNWKQIYGHIRKKCNNNRCRRKKERNDRNTVATYRTSARWRNSFQLHVSLEEWNPKRQRFLRYWILRLVMENEIRDHAFLSRSLVKISSVTMICFKNIVCCNVIIFIGLEIILYNSWRKYISLTNIYHYCGAIKWTVRIYWALTGICSVDEGLT